MAISDSQKVDALYKKLLFGVSKTDTASAKSPSNESIASPLLLRGDIIWNQSDQIPATAPASSTSVVGVYSDAVGNTVLTTMDSTAAANRTWKTGLTNWITPEFGSQYTVQVYAATSGAANPQTSGTKLFPDGNGNNDAWGFDYQAGVLNFLDTNIPTALTGKVIYIAGYKYIGTFGLSSAATAATTVTNNLSVTYGVSSTSTTTGALIVNGGVGIGENVNIGRNMTIGNTLKISGTATSTSTTTGALVVNGGAGIGGDVWIQGRMNSESVKIMDSVLDSTAIVLNTTATVVIDSYSISQFRSAKYLVQIDEGMGASAQFEVIEILLLVDNIGTVFATEYGLLTTNGEMGEFAAGLDVVDNNIKLYFTPFYASNKNIKVLRTGMSS
jgi:acetyltransferase-like isoleucine patch superfamily enzyme